MADWVQSSNNIRERDSEDSANVSGGDNKDIVFHDGVFVSSKALRRRHNIVRGVSC